MILFFHQQLEPNTKLISGRLLLIDTTANSIKNIYIATSGQANYQSSGALATRGKGPIPPVTDIGIPSYTVDTIPLYMPDVRGVEGNFHKINPHMVQIEGVGRGDFGIHFDANVPGSSGCVVLRTTKGWQAFQEDMKNLATVGLQQIPLLVSYAR